MSGSFGVPTKAESGLATAFSVYVSVAGEAKTFFLRSIQFINFRGIVDLI